MLVCLLEAQSFAAGLPPGLSKPEPVEVGGRPRGQERYWQGGRGRQEALSSSSLSPEPIPSSRARCVLNPSSRKSPSHKGVYNEIGYSG